MIGGKAHANHVIDISRQIVTDIDIIETANIDAINAWDIIPTTCRSKRNAFMCVNCGKTTPMLRGAGSRGSGPHLTSNRSKITR